MNDRVLLEVDAGVAHVVLNRADKLNALDGAMFGAIVDIGERVTARADVRAIVLSGRGSGFSAGLDASAFAAIGSGAGLGTDGPTTHFGLTERTHGIANRAQRVATVWSQAPMPVIAAIHGVCFGGGLQVALGADIRLVAPDARLSIMEIKWGLVPDMAGMATLRGRVRPDVLAGLVYTGRIVSGDEAVHIGLATRLSADPLQEALALAREIASKSPHAVRAAKRLLAAAHASDDATLLLAESAEQDRLVGSPNQIEAVRANLEKRPPRFVDPD